MMNKQKYAPFPNDPSPLKRRCRLLQSWYRVEVAREPNCGPWREGAGCVGSMLVNGEQTGANFISPAAFAYAREKAAEKSTNRDLTIDEYRLYNNMLSSMPMCFNLFADLRAGVSRGDSNAAAIVKAMFAESEIENVTRVEVELCPTPTCDYIDDKTAFDAAVLFNGKNGPGIASIETKYTDKLGSNIAAKAGKKIELSDKLSLFTPDGHAWYLQNGFDQISRNLLLTLAYADKHHLASAINYVLGPRDDDETPSAIESIKSRLSPEFRNRIIWLPLENAVERGFAVADENRAALLKCFYRRYLDFSQIAHLLKD